MTTGTYGALMRVAGFRNMLITQFLGALNDNLCKIVISLVAAAVAASTGGGRYLALGGALFILPYLLFSGYAGHLADAFNKRSVLIVTKMFEIVAMALAFVAFWWGSIGPMMGVLFLLGLQAAFFSPAKYGILPEMLDERDLSRANALVEMSTFLAIIAGTTIGSFLYDHWAGRLDLVGFLAIAIAVIGTMASLGVSRVPSPAVSKPMPLSPWSEIILGVRHLLADKPLWLTVVGISYFWFLGALLQLDVVLLGTQDMALDATHVGLMQATIAIGIGAGSIAAGRLSGNKVELGLVPLGSLGMVLGAVLLGLAAPSVAAATIALIVLGFSGGLFIIPLNAFLQQRSGAAERGRLLATNNFVNTVGILLASGALWLLRDEVGISASAIILVTAALTMLVTIYILTVVPDFLIRFVLWLVTHTFYRIRIVGEVNVPMHGPALLVCNHLSFVDGLLIGACIQRFIRFLVYKDYYEARPLNWLFRLMHAIPISERNPKEIIRALGQAHDELKAGHVVCIFAEGSLSRTGNLLPFRKGMEKISRGLDVPIIPVHLDRVWGSIFSFKDGRFFWKWPERLALPVTVSFGNSLPVGASAWSTRQAILELGSEAVARRRGPRDLLHLRFMAMAKRRWSSLCLADSTGMELNGGRALVGALLLSRSLRARLGAEAMVGVLLPASVVGVLVNVALLIAGKVPVNLNFTSGPEAMEHCIRQSSIKQILTSRLFLAKVKLAERPDMIFVEDLMKEVQPQQKLRALIAARLLPTKALERLYGLPQNDAMALAAVLFSSGSTGVPKGVMLSHHNILSNVEAVAQILWIAPSDRMMGALPFFHAFGLTGTIWIPLVCGIGAVYHANPLDAKTIGQMVARYHATVLIATPTFCQAYLRSVEASEFSSLRHVVVGAEKLQPALAAAFREKFHIEPLEGYGATEMGPVVAVNSTDVDHGAIHQTGRKAGTVGHPIPGVVARIVDPETGAERTPGEDGLLLLKGPGRMMGYLGDPERTASVLRGEWYVTGDIARLDEDGFIAITDRLSRFSKIGGEMVPHQRIEQAIAELPGVEAVAVTGAPDAQKGERLVVFFAGAPDLEPQAIWDALARSDLPRLWLPKVQNIRRIAGLPLLGTGKLDLMRLKQLALAPAEAG